MQLRETRNGIPSGEVFPTNTIKRWVERGCTNEAVALYGTSMEIARDIAQKGIVPSVSRENMLPYMRQLIGRNGHLYFFYPVIEQIKVVNPQLMEKYYPSFEGWTKEEVDEEMNIDRLKEKAKGYAAWQTLEHVVKRHTGIAAFYTSILHVSYDLLPQETEKGIGENLWEDKAENERDSRPEEVTQLMLFPDRELLVHALHEGLDRRGVLVYFNSGLFPNRAIPGNEDEVELCVVSSQPLKADIISGIEVLSEADRKALGF